MVVPRLGIYNMHLKVSVCSFRILGTTVLVYCVFIRIRKAVPLTGEHDVVIANGGPAGVIATIAATQQGT